MTSEQIFAEGRAIVMNDILDWERPHVCYYGGATYKVSGRLEKLSNCTRLMLFEERGRWQTARIEDVLASKRFDEQ